MIQSVFLTLAQAVPSSAAGGPPQGGAFYMIPYIAIAVLLYFVMMYPQQKRAKEQAALISSVKTGDSVIMNSGIHGIVTNVKETTLLVKVADNVKIEFDKAAVATVIKSSSES